jgi:hypothetical protein
VAQEDIAEPPILVTGAHRSGTTWVGKVLAVGPQVAYISEPLNLWHRRGVLRTPVSHWYTYICEENQSGYLPAFEELIHYRYHLTAEMQSLRSFKDFGRMVRDWNTFAKGRYLGQRPLIKDPFAIFSAEWFATRLNCQVVALVRHPAAVVGSLVRLNWPFQISDLLEQPLLMRDWLEPFRTEMESAKNRPEDIVDLGSLLWKLVYQVVGWMTKRNPGLILVRHEDLSLEPLEGFRNLYQALGLDYSPKAEETVIQYSQASNPGELTRKSIHSVRLDSRANLKNWKGHLSESEVDRIRRITEPVASQFYGSQDWE